MHKIPYYPYNSRLVSQLRTLVLIPTLVLFTAVQLAVAETAKIAVAANFYETAMLLAGQYQSQTGHNLLLNSGSTGALVAEIENGAAYSALLAADAKRPIYLEEYELAVLDTRFTYALGRLALASIVNKLPGPNMLRTGGYNNLGIANPELAPYGRAAMDTLYQMGLWTVAKPKLVTGIDVAETFQQILSGKIDIGFVALSQALQHSGSKQIYFWPVPVYNHAPIEQQAVLLEPGRYNAAAIGFLKFLQNEKSRALIAKQGYLLPKISDQP